MEYEFHEREAEIMEYELHEPGSSRHKSQQKFNKRESYALVAISFLTACDGFGPFAAAWLASNPIRQYGPGELGVIAALEEGARAILAPPLGRLVDISLRKRALLALGSFLVGMSVATTVFLARFVWVQALVKIPLAIGTCLVPLSVNALTLGTTAEERFTRQVAMNRAGGNFGNIASSISMALLSKALPDSPMWSLLPISFTAFALAAVPLIRTDRIDHDRAACRKSSDDEVDHSVIQRSSSEELLIASKSTWSQILRLMRLKNFPLLVSITFIFNITNMPQLMLVVQAAASDSPQDAIVFAGSAQIIANAVMSLSAAIVFNFADIGGRRVLLMCCCIVLPIRALVTESAMGLISSPWPALIICQLLDGFGAGLWEPLSILITRDVTEGTGCFNFAFSCVRVIFAAGAFLSSIITGQIAQKLGFGSGFFFLAMVGFLTTLLAARFPETCTRDASNRLSGGDEGLDSQSKTSSWQRRCFACAIAVCCFLGVGCAFGLFDLDGRTHQPSSWSSDGSSDGQCDEFKARSANEHICHRSLSPKHANGLIFIGLSLTRHSPLGNDISISRQTQFDFNLLQDREYQHVCETNDDGWLVGGGEGGTFSHVSSAWKLANPDSAHIELVHIGNGDVEHGGLTQDMIIQKMKGIRFKPIRLRPSLFTLNADDPPEVELRFAPHDNPELVDLQHKFSQVFTNPSVSWPDTFHMSISRKLRFYSSEDRDEFMRKGNASVERWRQSHPYGVVLEPDRREVARGAVTQEEVDKPGGVYLFWGRNQVHRYFPPTQITEEVEQPEMMKFKRSGALSSPTVVKISKARVNSSAELPYHCRAKHRCERPKSPKHANGLIFLGLSLSQRSPMTNSQSISRQTQFDFNLLQDRDYRYACETNDDGWLVGGGEGSNSSSLSSAWKLANPDSAHVEIAHIGNGDVEHGGLREDAIIEKMKSVQFKPIRVRPSEFALNSDDPPEVELRFAPHDNAELFDIQNKFREVFTNPSLTWPPYFHMSISRKLRFYSPEDRDEFMRKGNAAVEMWRQKYPHGVVLQPDPQEISRGLVTQEEIDRPGGVYLFWGRNEIRRYFPPTLEGYGTNETIDSFVPIPRTPEVVPPRAPLNLKPTVVFFTLFIYGLAWVLLMWPERFPLGRPGIALVFASLVCAMRGLSGSPVDIFEKIDPDPIMLLFGLMLVNTYLEDTGLWNHLGRLLDDENPKKMLIKICIASAIISALFLNDTTCIILTPIVLKLSAERKVHKVLPYLLAVSTSSNIGSSLTITGNPQNALIASLCPSIDFVGFLWTMAMPVAVGLSLNILILTMWFRHDLHYDDPSTPHDEWTNEWHIGRSRSKRLILNEEAVADGADDSPVSPSTPKWNRSSSGKLTNLAPEEEAEHGVFWFVKQLYWVLVFLIVLCMLAGWFLGLRTHETAVFAGATLMVARVALRLVVSCNASSARVVSKPRAISETETEFVIRHIDFPLLLLFMGQFVLIGAVVDTGVPQEAFHMTLGSCSDNLDSSFRCIFFFSGIVLVLSNIISNVPVILMLYPLFAGQPSDSVKEVWLVCAWVATIAGNLTMLGSAANLIVAQIATRERQFEYNATNVTKFSFAPTIFIAVIGVLVMPQFLSVWAASTAHGSPLIFGTAIGVVGLFCFFIFKVLCSRRKESRDSKGDVELQEGLVTPIFIDPLL